MPLFALFKKEARRTYEAPSGMGEPPVPLAIPAVLNAVFAAIGKRIRRVPVTADTFK